MVAAAAASPSARSAALTFIEASWVILLGSVFPVPVEQDLVVRPLHHLDLLRDAPHQRLLVQRNVRDVLMLDTVGLRDHIVALLGVGLDQDLLGERVHSW